MKLIVVGAGEVGSYLSSLLSDEGNEVTIIESDAARACILDEEHNVKVVRGNGSSAEVLVGARIHQCDFFLAMTSDDKTNVISTSLAHALGARTTLARIHDQTYSDTSFLNYRKHSNIDYLINPEALCAVELAKSIRNPGRVAVENFARGQVEVHQVALPSQSRMVGKKLRDLDFSPDIRIGFLQRSGSDLVPTADTILNQNDRLTLVGTPEALYETRRKFDPDSSRGTTTVVLYGGTEIAIALVRLINNPRFKVRIIERDFELCESLARKFPQVTIINGDATSLRLLEEEQVGQATHFVACTKRDEDNIVTSLQASKLGASHVQTVINKPDYDGVMDNLRRAIGVKRIVSPRIATANEILRYVSQKPYYELGTLPNNGGKILELVVREKAPAANKLIREIGLSQYGVMAALQHEYEVKVPGANDRVLPGDRIVVLTPEQHIKSVIRLLRG